MDRGGPGCRGTLAPLLGNGTATRGKVVMYDDEGSHVLPLPIELRFGLHPQFRARPAGLNDFQLVLAFLSSAEQAIPLLDDPRVALVEESRERLALQLTVLEAEHRTGGRIGEDESIIPVHDAH